MPTAVISDWNGTLTSATEEESNKHIGYTMLDDAKRERRFLSFAKLALTKVLTKRKLRAYKEGRAHLWEVYKPFNISLKGKPLEYVNSIVDDFVEATKGFSTRLFPTRC